MLLHIINDYNKNGINKGLKDFNRIQILRRDWQNKFLDAQRGGKKNYISD